MTAKKDLPAEEQKHIELLEELCEHTMAIRRVVNRILDHLHEYYEDVLAAEEEGSTYHDPDDLSLDDFDNGDDMYY